MKKVAIAIAVILVGLVAEFYVIHNLIGGHSVPTAASSTSTISSQKKTAKRTASSTETEVKDNTIPSVVNNSAIDQYLTAENFSGTVLVERQGQTVVSKAYGLANREKNIANTVASSYYIGSAQKSIVATAILQLEQAGKIKIDDPVQRYLPHFPNGAVITLRNLLNHTSGIKGRAEKTTAIGADQVIEEIEAAGIKAQPGSWDYQDSNYAVLAYIVAQVSNQSYESYVQQHIFNPAGMLHAGFYETNQKLTEPAASYTEKNGLYTISVLPDISQIYGAGDMFMTASDLFYYDKALMAGKLINQAELKEMFTAGSSSTYGMGFYVNPGSYSSHGVLGGFNTINEFTKTGLTYILLLGNTNTGSLGKEADHILEILNN